MFFRHHFTYLGLTTEENPPTHQEPNDFSVCLVERVQHTRISTFSNFKSNLFHIISVEWLLFWCGIQNDVCIRQLLSVLLTILDDFENVLFDTHISYIFAFWILFEVGCKRFLWWRWRRRRKTNDSSWLQVNSKLCLNFVWWNSWNYIESLALLHKNRCFNFNSIVSCLIYSY